MLHRDEEATANLWPLDGDLLFDRPRVGWRNFITARRWSLGVIGAWFLVDRRWPGLWDVFNPVGFVVLAAGW